MTENTGSDSNSRLKKLIIIEVVVFLIAAIISAYLMKHVDIMFITLLLAVSFLSILAVPCTIGLFWHDLSLEAHNNSKLAVVFMLISSVIHEIIRLYQNRIGIIQAISSIAIPMILIYLPFFIGRGIYTLRSRLHKA